jgi:uncharacterized membrane protein
MIELPPLHPMLVHFPVALLPISVTCDVLGHFKRRASLAHAAWWTLLFAAIASPLTAASGWLWLFDMDGMEGTLISVHQWLGTLLPLLLIALAMWRYRFHARAKVVPFIYLVTASVVLLAMVVQGHVGATLTFGAPHDHEPTTQAAQPPAHDHAHDSSADEGWQDSIRPKEHRHE